MKRAYLLTIRGRSREWAFTVYEDPRHIDTWRADGLDIAELVNTVPAWVADLGLMRLWCWLQDRGVLPL